MHPTLSAATSSAEQLAVEVATAAAPSLAPGVALTLGAPQPGPFELSFGYAVVCPLGGVVNGELALFVDDDFGRALTTADIGELDLAAALGPAMEQIAARLGSVLLGTAATVDARMAQQRINGFGDSSVVALDDTVAVRAAVAVGVDPSHPLDAGRPVASPPVASANERLDLLRHVEMAATVELGRARMTINELLSLRDGAIIELDRAAGEAADLFVNGRLIARGEIVVVDENYALRVTQIVTDEQGR